METPLTFAQLVSEMKDCESQTFEFRGRETRLTAKDDVAFVNAWGAMRILSFGHLHAAGGSTSIQPSLDARYNTIRYSGYGKNFATDPQKGIANHISIGFFLSHEPWVVGRSPSFTEDDLAFSDEKGLKYKKFDPDDPFVRLLRELLAAAKNPVDVQKGIAEAIRELGLVK